MAAAPAGRGWRAACCFARHTTSAADERQQQQALPASQAGAGNAGAPPTLDPATVIVHAPPPPAAKGATAAAAACAPSVSAATEAEPGTPLPAGRSMGSLTAWQMLAADLAAEGSVCPRGFSAGGELRYLEQQGWQQERGAEGDGGGGGGEGRPSPTSSSEAEQGLELLLEGLPFGREG